MTEPVKHGQKIKKTKATVVTNKHAEMIPYSTSVDQKRETQEAAHQHCFSLLLLELRLTSEYSPLRPM